MVTPQPTGWWLELDELPSRYRVRLVRPMPGGRWVPLNFINCVAHLCVGEIGASMSHHLSPTGSFVSSATVRRRALRALDRALAFGAAAPDAARTADAGPLAGLAESESFSADEWLCRQSPRCDRHRVAWPMPAAGEPLVSFFDAVGVLLGAVEPGRQAVVAIPLDAAHVGRTVMVIDGAIGNEFEQVLEVVVNASGPSLAGVVMAWFHPAGFGSDGVCPSDVLHEEFFDLRERGAQLGVDVLDWILVDDTHAISLQQITDAQCLWREPFPC
jgi:hypothetical protein